MAAMDMDITFLILVILTFAIDCVVDIVLGFGNVVTAKGYFVEFIFLDVDSGLHKISSVSVTVCDSHPVFFWNRNEEILKYYLSGGDWHFKKKCSTELRIVVHPSDVYDNIFCKYSSIGYLNYDVIWFMRKSVGEKSLRLIVRYFHMIFQYGCSTIPIFP